MKFLSYGRDGGPKSNVRGFWLVEIKELFSSALLRFSDGSRDQYHSHAFDSMSWLVFGELREELLTGEVLEYRPGLRPIVTRRSTFHRVRSCGTSWVLTFRGPWAKTWLEFDPVTRILTTLTNGRKVVGRVWPDGHSEVY